MKITKRELKELLREQVKTVVDEVWIKVGDDEPPLPSHSEHGPYAPEEGEEDEWPEASWEQDPSWRDEDDLYSGPEDPEGRVPGQPKEPEEGGVVDLRGQKPITRQSIARLKHRIKQHTGEEPVDIGMVDPRTGKVRVSESDLKDMIRATLEEVMDEVEEGTAMLDISKVPLGDVASRTQADLAAKALRKRKRDREKERKEKEAQAGQGEELEEECERSAKGNITQKSREKHAAVGDDKFPICDKKSAMAALDLRGHGTTDAQREDIIRRAAEYAPEAAKKAREADEAKK